MSVNRQGQSALQQISGNVVPDAALSTTSTNSVQNKVVTEEINTIKSNLNDYQVVKERIADGVKTYSQLLDEMGAQTNQKYKFRMIAPNGDVQIADLGVMTNSKAIYEFRTFDPSTPLMNTHEYDIRWSGSTYEWYSVGSAGLTFQDRSSNVVPSGTKFQYVI